MSSPPQRRSSAPPVRVPASVEANDRVLTRAVAADDVATAVVTAVRQVKACNEAAIRALFPGNESPWETHHHHNSHLAGVSAPRLNRAAQLLGLAQRYLAVVAEYTANTEGLLPPAGTIERLCAAWPTVVTQSHVAIVSFYQGRPRLALAYAEAAIGTALSASVSGTLVCSLPRSSPAAPLDDPRLDWSTLPSEPTATVIGSGGRRDCQRSASASSKQRRAASPTSAPSAATAAASDNLRRSLSLLRPAATQMVRAMGGSTLCAAQLVVLVLNYARILSSLQRHDAARDCCSVARGMLADLNELAFAQAARVVAELAQDQTQDWPSLLNGRTSMPFLQAFCAFLSGDVELLAAPTEPLALRNVIQWLREADAAAEAVGLPRDGNSFRAAIAAKLRLACEQLDVVQAVLARNQQQRQLAEDVSAAWFSDNGDCAAVASTRMAQQRPDAGLRQSVANRLRGQVLGRRSPSPAAAGSSFSPAPRCPSSMRVVHVNVMGKDTFVACGSPAKLRGVLETFREARTTSVLNL